jgi:hypothetical protein
LWLRHEILLWLDHLDTPPRGAGRRQDKGHADLVATDTLYARPANSETAARRYFRNCVHGTLPLPRGGPGKLWLRLLAWPLALAGALFGGLGVEHAARSAKVDRQAS